MSGVNGFIYHRTRSVIFFWTLLIFALCSVPGEYIPSTTWLDLLGADKWVHAFIFFVLNALLILDLAKKRKGGLQFFISFLACVGYGVVLELMQAWVFSHRSADLEDAAANMVGCLVALLFAGRIRKFAV